MKRKIIFSTLTITVLVFMLYSCTEDFLETLPTAAGSAPMLANEEGVDMLLIGAYAGLDGQMSGTSGSSWGSAVSNWVWGDVASDDASKGGGGKGDQSPIAFIEDFTVLPDNVYLKYKWNNNYDGIGRANDVLRVMAMCDPPLTEEKQTSVKAQALFIRGYIHFELKRVFNNIPYINEVDDPVTVQNNVDTWPKIEADLQYAVDHLPNTQKQVGRPTKYAAEAVLARVYLFQKKWDEAKVLLDDIIASGKYSLMPNFGDNFNAENNNNIESIYEIQSCVNDGADGSANGNWGDCLNFPMNLDGAIPCCGFHVPTQNLVNAFQVDADGLPLGLTGGPVPNFKHDYGIQSDDFFVQDTVTPVDPRLDLTVGRRGVPYLDWGIMRGYRWCNSQLNGGPYINKKYMYLQKDMGTESTTTGWALGVNSSNFRLIRYAHILLWRAEVAAETGDFAMATTLVNQIRTRANNQKVMGRCRTFNLPGQTGLEVDYTIPATNYLVNPYPNTFPDLDYARKAIRREMRLEFAMGGYRFFDLIRWGIAEPTINAYFDQDREIRPLYTGTPQATFIANKNEYWPIPQTQIELQPGVLTQNSGW
jgi:hypothetical protein